MPSSQQDLADFRHELSNPLGALLGEVQIALLDRAALPDHLVETLERMEQLVLRMRELVRKREA